MTSVLEPTHKPIDPLGHAEPSKARTGVPHYARHGTEADYRTYEIYQRERVHESTEKIRPVQLISAEFVENPYPVLEILRENYPCYRNWVGNCFWITRYDDVTSIFTDDANFETRPKRWFYRLMDYGRDLGSELPVLFAFEQGFDSHIEAATQACLSDIRAGQKGDLALQFAARLPMELLTRTLGLPREDFAFFVDRFWKMQRGYDWNPKDEQAGKQAMRDLAAYFGPLLEARRKKPGEDLLSAFATLEREDGRATPEDVVITLLEMDHETLHGGLANMWFLLLSHPDQLAHVSEERRMVKFAWLETMRHSQPVLWKKRFALHEVERFGRLLPEGGLLYCAAAAANRDPRQFSEPDKFIVGRRDLCQREPRGHYRADGLPSGVAMGLGKPSKYPALPEDRPRSLYAITRDMAVTASNLVLDELPGLRLADGAQPKLRSLRLNEMH
ncbi:MAG: hypothetical protein R3360_06215, partial [Alphaproteobacteria bacterium]|nr:hypothetical protein [Alphaproteobacteria bacterium]